MLSYLRKSILESEAQTLVNTVNIVGVMGKGLASQFKARHPDMFLAYKRICHEGLLDIGKLWLWKSPDQWVLNFPTKKHWRQPSKLAYIEAGLGKLTEEYEHRGIRELAFPRLGCGNGGLDWADVQPLMEQYLAPLPIPIYIHDYEADIGEPEHLEAALDKAFERSFDAFLDDLRVLLLTTGGNFKTVSNGTAFSASFSDAGDLHIERPNGVDKVSKDDLYEIWTLLFRGPVTRRRLSGGARQAAYYLFAIFSHLSYVRPVEMKAKDDITSTAIEILNKYAKIEIVSEIIEEKQSVFEWV